MRIFQSGNIRNEVEIWTIKKYISKAGLWLCHFKPLSPFSNAQISFSTPTDYSPVLHPSLYSRYLHVSNWHRHLTSGAIAVPCSFISFTLVFLPSLTLWSPQAGSPTHTSSAGIPSFCYIHSVTIRIRSAPHLYICRSLQWPLVFQTGSDCSLLSA
jgi:hypothetical protein